MTKRYNFDRLPLAVNSIWVMLRDLRANRKEIGHLNRRYRHGDDRHIFGVKAENGLRVFTPTRDTPNY